MIIVATHVFMHMTSAINALAATGEHLDDERVNPCIALVTAFSWNHNGVHHHSLLYIYFFENERFLVYSKKSFQCSEHALLLSLN